MRATGQIRNAVMRSANGTRRRMPRGQQMRCNAAGVPCHRKGRTVERNETEGGIKRRQMLGQELVGPWAKTRVEQVLPHATAHKAAPRALLLRRRQRGRRRRGREMRNGRHRRRCERAIRLRGARSDMGMRNVRGSNGTRKGRMCGRNMSR
jgi:hypothetical protein